ncbi:hypothetical protein J437_LFUL014071 [Ladona fulva]|uniref:Uncharacterized protein n=1 Tax=Ladona fulva TaxID=123851 RepID=A0A8K0KND7_LADFU|nr:hypothetical protein J437_LFUL014071 [Ladona fulva]
MPKARSDRSVFPPLAVNFVRSSLDDYVTGAPLDIPDPEELLIVTGNHVTRRVPSCGPASTWMSTGGSGRPAVGGLKSSPLFKLFKPNPFPFQLHLAPHRNRTTKTSKEELESVPKLIDTATYPLWEFEIRILFEAKRLMSMIDGTSTLEQCSMDEKKKREWITKDANAKIIILRK